MWTCPKGWTEGADRHRDACPRSLTRLNIRKYLAKAVSVLLYLGPVLAGWAAAPVAAWPVFLCILWFSSLLVRPGRMLPLCALVVVHCSLHPTHRAPAS